MVSFIDPLKPSSKWVEDPPSYVEEIGGVDEAPIPGYSYQDYDPLGIAVDEARVGRNRLPEQVESLYPEGMLIGYCIYIDIDFMILHKNGIKHE